MPRREQRHLPGALRSLAHFSANACSADEESEAQRWGHTDRHREEGAGPADGTLFLPSLLCGEGSLGRSACDPHSPRPGSRHPEGAIPSPLGTPLCPQAPACVPPPEGCGPCAHQGPAAPAPCTGAPLQPMSLAQTPRSVSGPGVAPPLGSCIEWMAWWTPRATLGDQQ